MSDLQPWNDPAQLEQLKQMAVERERTGFQTSLFPNWPDDRRGAPNEVIRSAIFGVVEGKKRSKVTDFHVAAPAGSTITMTGWRLDQHDCDIWLEVMHLARNQKPGEVVRFTVRSFLKRLHRTAEGSTNYTWLKERLSNLTKTTIAFENSQYIGVAGAMLSSFRIDKNTGEGVIRTNPELRALWQSVTHIDIEQRLSLGQNQLAKALHAVIASHASWVPMRLDTLMQRVGAQYKRVRNFRAALELVLDDFVTRGWIRSYSIGKGDGGLVGISKVPTPSQARFLEGQR